jgi:exopolyphosphatase / guanosine-5'-triphosphate,3'-diphosphate pyrophosphatase
VSKPHQGGHTPPEAPARKKRRKRRPRNRRAGERRSLDGTKAQGGAEDQAGDWTSGLAAVERRAGEGSWRRSPQPDAVAALLSTAEAPRAEGRAGRTAGNPHRRQYGHRSKSERPIRNLRAPVVPTPAATYTAVEVDHRQAMPENAAGGGMPARPGAFAALDLGTNNCRLLIAVPSGYRRFRVIDAFSRIIRLGEGLQSSGALSEAAMLRAIEALGICANKLASHSLIASRMIATEACRHASNGAEFLERVQRATGLELEIVDRETEARLAAEGCGDLMDRHAQGAVLFDIGGGSSELVLVDRRNTRSRRISRQIRAWTSLPLGVVTLSERHGGRQVSRRVFDNMVEEVLRHVETFEGRNGLAEFWSEGRAHLLGTSGTVTTIAGVHLNLARYDRRRVDGMWLSGREIDKVIDDLLEMDYERRAGNPCIGRDRADLVLAGCAILQAIRLTWPSERLRVADRGLREGILSELMHQNNVWENGERGQQTGGRRSWRPSGATAKRRGE